MADGGIGAWVFPEARPRSTHYDLPVGLECASGTLEGDAVGVGMPLAEALGTPTSLLVSLEITVDGRWSLPLIFTHNLCPSRRIQGCNNRRRDPLGSSRHPRDNWRRLPRMWLRQGSTQPVQHLNSTRRCSMSRPDSTCCLRQCWNSSPSH